MNHDELKKKAIQAIQNLNCDTSVSQEKTLESLGEIKSEISMMEDAIEFDIRNR